MNIDFDARPGFSIYVLLLMFSGVVMIVLASPAVKRSSTGVRVLNGIFGAGFFGYGFYLAFIFDGGTYLIFFKAFILPVVLIVRTFRGMATYGPPVPAPAPYAAPGTYPPPPGYAGPHGDAPPQVDAPPAPPGAYAPPSNGYAPPAAAVAYALAANGYAPPSALVADSQPP